MWSKVHPPINPVTFDGITNGQNISRVGNSENVLTLWVQGTQEHGLEPRKQESRNDFVKEKRNIAYLIVDVYALLCEYLIPQTHWRIK